MGTGSQYDSSNKTGSYSSINLKTRLIDTGTAINSATKIGGGQDAFATTTSAGFQSGTDYQLDLTGTLWQPKIAQLLHKTKSGEIYPVTTTFNENSEGLWNGSTVTGTPTVAALDTVEGLAAVYTSGAGAGNQAGVNRALLFTTRGFNPTFKLRWKLDEAGANIRFYAGWTGSTAIIGNSDDPLNAANGFGIGVSTAQANYRIMYNDGVGATAQTDTTIVKDTAYHTIELWADDNAAKFWWSFDGSTPASVSTDIPASTTSLSCQFTVTAVNADAKPMNILKAAITSDK